MSKGEDVTTRFIVDVSDLKKNISDATQSIKLANAQFKAAAAGMDDWKNSSEGLTAKLKQLNTVREQEKAKMNSYQQQMDRLKNSYNENGQRVEQLKSKLQELANKGVSKTSDEYKKYEKALVDCEKEQNANKKAIDTLNITITNQQGKINGIDKDIRNYTNSLNNLGKEEKEVNEGTKQLSEGFTVVKGVISNLVTQGINVAVNGLKKLGSATVNLAKEAITSYGSYEQLVGGVETLFKNSAKEVENYANNAYKTAGLDANKYMETITSFSASLLQGLHGDTAKAAKVADLAITDMSDNANKMGTDMSMIQSAYQRICKTKLYNA